MIGSPIMLTVGVEGGAEGPIGWPGGPGDEAKAAGLSVADAGLAIEAAAAGFGRATVPRLLVEGDIAAGRVVEFARREAGLPCWLIAPLPQWRQKKVRALVTALTEE